MKYFILLLIICSCTAASCNKEKLPEYYFKCKVEGQEYVPDDCANCRTAYLLGDTIILIQGSRSTETISLFSSDRNIKETTYTLNHERTKHDALYDNTIGNPSDIFRTDSIRTGQLSVITLDKTNKIIAGTFYFEAYNAVQNKTVKITEGKFRLQYKTN
jgi:hypothetical protein